MRSKEVSEAIKRINKVREKQFNQFEQTGKTNITIGVNDLRAIDTVLSYIEELEQETKEIEFDLTSVYMSGFYDGEKKYKDKIRDKIKEIENDGIWITEDYYYDKELGEEYPTAQSNFSKEEMEDIVVDILKSIIGEK